MGACTEKFEYSNILSLSSSSRADNTAFLDFLDNHPYHPLLLGDHPVGPLSAQRCSWSAKSVASVGVHRRTSLMSSFLSLQQLLVFLAHLTMIVCEIGGKWLCSRCFMGCWVLFKTACNILSSSRAIVRTEQFLVGQKCRQCWSP